MEQIETNLFALINHPILENPLQHWLIAVGIAAGLWMLLGLIKRLLIRRIGRVAASTETGLDDLLVELLKATKGWFMLIAGLFAGSLYLSLPGELERIVRSVAFIALLVQAGVWIGLVIQSSLERYRKRQLARDPSSVTTLNAIGFLSKIVLWSLILLVALDNLGVNVTALIAGLGVGGIAVALAVQNILGDLFASLSIVLDKPFSVGDFLIIDDFLGSVEHVGLKTTRMRSLSGEQLVFSNSDLLGSRIRNYGRMFERRVVFSIGVTYQTPREKLKKIPQIIKTAVEAQERTRFDRSHFKEYGNFSLNFETVYYVLVPDYNAYMDIQQAINLHIHEQFENEEIEFAYPTQTLFVQPLDTRPALKPG